MSEKIKLGEIIDTIQGSQYPLDEQITENKEGYLRFLRISDYTKSDEPIRYVKYSGKELVCKEDEVVVVRYGNIGFIGYGKKGILANNLFVLRLKNKSFDSKYLYYYLNSPNINKAIVNKANSSTMPALTHKMIKELEIPVVDIEEQKSIVSKLNKIQKIIDIRKKQIEELDELIKSQFVEMFGNNKYEQKNLKDIANIGSSKRIYAKEYKKNGIPFYRSKEIRELGSGLKPSTELFISKEKYNEVKQKYGIPKKGDILIAAIGATIGYMWIVDDSEFYYKDGNLILISSGKGINPIYLKYTLEKNIDQFKRNGASGSAQLAMTIEKVEKFIISIPPIELQNKFAESVKNVDKKKFEIQKSLNQMQELYESLMDKYFG